MAEIKRYEQTKFLPRFTCSLYEGVATIRNVFDKGGGRIDDTLTWNAELTLGDKVKMYATGDLTMTVAKLAADDNSAIGEIVDAPELSQTPITGTAGSNVTPTSAQYRRATVAFYGQAITMMKNDGAGAIGAGDQLGWSSATAGSVEAGTPIAGVVGTMVSLGYAAAVAGTEFPALLGYFGWAPNTA